jgi:hypothetical protein
MENIKIKLSSGKIVTLEAFNMSMTYAGLLVGEPNNEMNDSIISQISYPTNWGTRKAVLNKTDMYTSKNVLKPIIYSVWLTASAVLKINDGSSMVLIWFGENSTDKSIQEIIIKGVGGFDWNKHAESFEY